MKNIYKYIIESCSIKHKGWICWIECRASNAYEDILKDYQNLIKNTCFYNYRIVLIDPKKKRKILKRTRFKEERI